MHFLEKIFAKLLHGKKKSSTFAAHLRKIHSSLAQSVRASDC